MEREILKPDKETARDIISKYSKEFEVIEKTQTDSSRWSAFFDCIVRRKSDGKFFETSYTKGLTEYQPERPFEYDEPVFSEVIPLEKTVTYYGWPQ